MNRKRLGDSQLTIHAWQFTKLNARSAYKLYPSSQTKPLLGLCLSIGLACSSNKQNATTEVVSASTSASFTASNSSGAQPTLSQSAGFSATASAQTLSASASSAVTAESGSASATASNVHPAPSSAASTETSDAGSASSGSLPDASTLAALPCTQASPFITGTETRNADSNAQLSAALNELKSGGRVRLAAGAYNAIKITDFHASDYVIVEPADAATVTFQGATLRGSDHIALRNIQVLGTLELNASHDILLDHVTLDGGSTDVSALMIQGQDSGGATHHVKVVNSTLKGGGRTVFVLGRFAASSEWNHDLEFLENQFTCGSRVCFQISGGKNVRIEHNRIQSAGATAILTAGANQVLIARNRMLGSGGSGAQLATPGAEWDNYAGVENMISSQIEFSNNATSGWGSAVQLDAATQVDIVHNSVIGSAGINFNHRTPKAQDGTLILNGNSEIRVWNNILPAISLAQGETRPSFESNNAVLMGGGGQNLITTAIGLDVANDFALPADSPALDAALRNGDTPVVDLDNALRGDQPDLGARESAPLAACEP